MIRFTKNPNLQKIFKQDLTLTNHSVEHYVMNIRHEYMTSSYSTSTGSPVFGVTIDHQFFLMNRSSNGANVGSKNTNLLWSTRQTQYFISHKITSFVQVDWIKHDVQIDIHTVQRFVHDRF